MGKIIVGSGQLARCFLDSHIKDVVIFASGVSDSNCTDIKQFEREKKLLTTTLTENPDKKFVYFSCCALSAIDYPKNDYYRHKEKMEKVIKFKSNNYYIIRLPQLFGHLIPHKTLINYLYMSIINGRHFDIYNGAYRYVIEINDVRNIVEAYLKDHNGHLTVDVANPYRYRVLDIVYTFEKLLGKKADYSLIQNDDKYTLNLQRVLNFVEKFNIHVDFGKDYLKNKLINKIKINNQQ